MGKIRTLSLTTEQRRELERGYQNGPSHAFRKRCHLVLLKSSGAGPGRTSKQVGQILSMTPLSINNWLTRYEHEGIDGLKTKPGRGPKAKLDVEKDADFVKALVQKHRQEIHKAKAEIESHIDQPLSQRTLRRFLKKLVADTNEFANG